MRLIKLADIKEYLPLLDRGEISHSKFADLLNEAALKALREYITQRPATSRLPAIESIDVGFYCIKCGAKYDEKYNKPCKCDTE